MSRNMWILGAVLMVFVLTMFYQSEFGGGIERPWMDCKGKHDAADHVGRLHAARRGFTAARR